MRGVFMRGLDVFQATGEPPLDPVRSDPDRTRAVGSYQPDMLKQHQHELGYGKWGLKTGNCCADLENLDTGNQMTPVSTLPNKGPDSGPETRPKNVAMYYYVKIND
jgi:hypothetical protein